MKALESFPELDSAGNFEQLYLKAFQGFHVCPQLYWWLGDRYESFGKLSTRNGFTNSPSLLWLASQDAYMLIMKTILV